MQVIFVFNAMHSTFYCTRCLLLFILSERIHKNVITLTDDIWMNLPYELWNLDKFR